MPLHNNPSGKHNNLVHVAILILVASSLVAQAGCSTSGGGGSGQPPPPGNPVPNITSLSPSSVTAGAPAQPLTIQGSNFLSTSTVTYNGQTHTATFTSSTQLSIPLSASDQETAGSFVVIVTNPAPGGGPSNSAKFVVNPPPPPPTATLKVKSSNPSSSVQITASPADNGGQSAGTTPFQLTYDIGATVSLTAPATVGSNALSWKGCDSVSGTTCAATMNADRTVTAQYGTPGAPGFTYVPNQNSSDVSAYEVDSTSGALSPLTPLATYSASLAPASVASDPTAHCLYVGSQGGVEPALAVFTIDPATGELTSAPSPSLSVSESIISAVAVDPAGKFVFTTSLGGVVSALSFDPATCALTEAPGSPFAAGTLPWALAVDPTATFLYVANFGDNNISGFRIDSSTGALTPLGSVFPTGVGPTSVAVHPSGRFLLAANSLDNNVSVYNLDPSTGGLTSIANSPFSADLGSASVAVDPSGKFVYVANIGPLGVGDVSAFSIDAATGDLTSVAGSPFPAGSMSEFVDCDPSGNFVYVANFGSSSLSGFRIDRITGALTPIAGSPFQAGGGPISIAITVLPSQ